MNAEARNEYFQQFDFIHHISFTTGSGGVTERRNAVDAAEDLARKGQELREMTRDLDLLRVDVDVIAMVVRLRGAFAPTDRTYESSDGEQKEGE